MKELEWSQAFPHYNTMRAICYHGNQSSYSIWPKTQSPIPMMLQLKFDSDQSAVLRDIHVWKCGQTDGRTLARVPTYKLTLSLRLWWAKNAINSNHMVYFVADIEDLTWVLLLLQI